MTEHKGVLELVKRLGFLGLLLHFQYSLHPDKLRNASLFRGFTRTGC